jgi:hypothetical protein
VLDYTRLDGLARDKHFSLLGPFVSYKEMKCCECNGAMTFSITTLTITTLSIKTLSIMTLSIMTLSITMRKSLHSA